MDRIIPALLFVYREVPRESLGFSPFELLYGRTVKGPMQVLRQMWTNEEMDGEMQTTAVYVTDFRNRLEEMCSIAQQNLQKAGEKHAKYYDRRATKRELQVGKRVLFNLLLPTKKLELAGTGMERASSSSCDQRKGQRLRLPYSGGMTCEDLSCQLVARVQRERFQSTQASEEDNEEEEEEEVAMVVEEEESDDDDDWSAKSLPTLNTVSKESFKDVKYDMCSVVKSTES